MFRKVMLVAGLLTGIAACSNQPLTDSADPSAPVVLFEGARLIPGDGSAPIEDSAFMVVRGTISRTGKRGDVPAPAGATRVDLTGKTVMPALISAHVHPGFQKGSSYSGENYTRYRRKSYNA